MSNRAHGSVQRAVIAATISATVALGARAASADEKQDADRLFQEGRALMLEERFAEACPRIAESQRIDPHVGTLLNLAACHEKSGKVASAWVAYQQALTTARAEGQAERERLALERIEVLEPRVPWIVVAVPSEPAIHGLSVTLDGALVQPFAWGKDMPVDPGQHTVAASAPDRTPWQLSIEMRESERRTIAVPALETIAQKPPPVLPATRDATPTSEAGATARETKPPARWSFSLGLLGGFLATSGGRAEPQVEPGSISVRETSGRDTTCASAGCYYTMDRESAGLVGLVVGGDYSLAEGARVGGRFLAGPRLGRGGGSLFALGPSLSIDIADTVWTGVAGLLGGGTMGGHGEVVPPANAYASGGPYLMNASVGDPAFGASIELGVLLLKLPRGSVGVSVMPLFLHGASSTLWCVPATVAYRF